MWDDETEQYLRGKWSEFPLRNAVEEATGWQPWSDEEEVEEEVQEVVENEGGEEEEGEGDEGEDAEGNPKKKSGESEYIPRFAAPPLASPFCHFRKTGRNLGRGLPGTT